MNAVVSLDGDRARELAEAADAALERGEDWGPLHGVPMTLKDAHDVAGLRTTLGAFELDRVADEDGTVADRLRAAGAIIIGHERRGLVGRPQPECEPGLRSHQQPLGHRPHPWRLERRGSCRARGRHDVARGRLGHGRLDPAARALLRGLRPQDDRAPRTTHRLLPSSGGSPAAGPHHLLPRSDGA